MTLICSTCGRPIGDAVAIRHLKCMSANVKSNTIEKENEL
jgi:hypothetical protein